MKLKLLIFSLLIGQFGFTQLPTYKAKYSCIKSMTLLSASDTTSMNTDELSMEAEIEVIANNKYALITTTILKVNSPIFQNELEQLRLKNNAEVNFVEYETKTVYFINDNKAFTYLSDIFDTSNHVEKIGNYTCNLSYEKTGNTLREVYNIWTSKMTPWYINPGLFYSQDLGGIVKLDNTETVLELKEIDKTEFDFKYFLNKIESIDKVNTTESRLKAL